MTNLDKLIEAVEAGELDIPDGAAHLPYVTAFFDRWRAVYSGDAVATDIIAWSAYTGSLDAALALKEAVLPNTAIYILSQWPGENAEVELWGTHEGSDGERWHRFEDGKFEAEATTPARALLLATLKALKEKEDG